MRASWRWAALAAWIFMLPVAVLMVGFSLALEPFAERAGTAAAVYGLFQMSGSAVIATALLDQGVAPQVAMGLIGVLIVAPLLCLSGAMARRRAYANQPSTQPPPAAASTTHNGDQRA